MPTIRTGAASERHKEKVAAIKAKNYDLVLIGDLILPPSALRRVGVPGS